MAGAKIHYLYHSGFAVETDKHVLLFDYWKDTPTGAGLEDGVIDPAALAGRDVLVFVSHAHHDHYNPCILGWRGKIPRLRLILSDDVPPAQGAFMLGPNRSLRQPDCTIETFASTDAGVAFLVEIDGLRIYHAGDLNWWHWEGESRPYNDGMAERYKEQIALLAAKPIDLAFVPVDPRLGAQYGWGLDHLMRAAEIAHAVPMHFGDNASVVQRLLTDPATADYRERILPLTTRGQSVTLE